jgi:pyruvate dehydrogenase E1 component alpha subunit
MSDPGKYRTREEIQKIRSERDCIEAARHKLIEWGVDEEALKQIDTDIKARINEAAEFAQASPEPAESELWTDVLVEG